MNENKEKHYIYKIYKNVTKEIKNYKIKRRHIPSYKKDEYPYNASNNYGFLNLMPINKKILKSIKEIKTYYTTSSKNNELKYYNCNYLKNKLSKLNKKELNIDFIKNIILQKKTRSISKRSYSKKRSHSKRKSQSRKRSHSRKKSQSKILQHNTIPANELVLQRGGSLFGNNVTLTNFRLFEDYIQVYRPIGEITTIILFYIQKMASGNFKPGEHYHLRENTTANNLSNYFLEIECFMFETTDLDNLIRYKKFIGDQHYNAYNSTAIMNEGIFNSEQMRNNVDYKYKYTFRDFTDQNMNVLYNNSEINNLPIFDNELTPNSVNYVYLFEDDFIDNSNTKFVKDTNLEITLDDINSMRCYTKNWDAIINPYFYNHANYWAAGEIGETVIINSNTTWRSPNIVDLQPDNCRTVMVNGIFPAVIDRPILEEEIENKIESYKTLFFNKGFMTKNNGGTNIVSFDGGEYNTVYRGNSFDYHLRSAVPGTDYVLQNYTSTAVELNPALGFIDLYYNADSTLYEITFDEGIPYIVYDDLPYNSYFNKVEKEILFPPNCIISLLGPSRREILNIPGGGNNGRPYKHQRVHLSWNIDIPILQEKNKSVIDILAETKCIGIDYTIALQTLQRQLPQLQFNIFPP
jgi:hypothetical protein